MFSAFDLRPARGRDTVKYLPGLDFVPHPVRLHQRGMLRVFSGGRDAAHEDGSGKARPLKAFDPAFQAADGALGNVLLILCGGSEEIYVAESVIAREKRVESVEQGFELPRLSLLPGKREKIPH